MTAPTPDIVTVRGLVIVTDTLTVPVPDIVAVRALIGVAVTDTEPVEVMLAERNRPAGSDSYLSWFGNSSLRRNRADATDRAGADAVDCRCY